MRCSRPVMAWRLVIIVLGVSLLAHGQRVNAGAVVYVDDDAPPGGDGASWNTAFRYLQDALAGATPGISIRVGAGTYLPDHATPDAPDGSLDRSATFQLSSGVVLFGGFAGFGADDPDDRDIERYATKLSGDLLGNDGPAGFQNYDDNSMRVVTVESQDDGRLDGFTITAGSGTPDPAHASWLGGGMLISNSSPVVFKCTFVANRAGGTYDPFSFWAGGGLAIVGDSRPAVTDCSFSENRTDGAAEPPACGGGMYIGDGACPTVTRCAFTGNWAPLGGGLCIGDGNATIAGCTFNSNEAIWGGGGAAVVYGSPIIVQCSFFENWISCKPGGGLYNGFGSSPTVTRCKFKGNSAKFGGAVFTEGSGNVSIGASRFDDNAPNHIWGPWTDIGDNRISPPAPGSIDLTRWTVEDYPATGPTGLPEWTVSDDGSIVRQAYHGTPSVFCGDFSVSNTKWRATISTTGGASKFVGFVIGFHPGDTQNSDADYLLIDWKRNNELRDFGCGDVLAQQGLAVSRVFGIPTAGEIWSHANIDEPCAALESGIEELQRGLTLGDVAWSSCGSHEFRFELRSESLLVYVDGTLELDVAGDFNGGRFGFYNFWQNGVVYDAEWQHLSRD